MGLLLPAVDYLDGQHFDAVKAVAEYKVEFRATNSNTRDGSNNLRKGAADSQNFLRDIQRLALDMQEIRLDRCVHACMRA